MCYSLTEKQTIKKATSIKARKKRKLNSNKILAYVRLGMACKKCQNYGICEIQMLEKRSEVAAQSKKSSICNIEVTSQKKLQFSFDMSSITSECQEKHFGRGYFRVGEAYIIPIELTESLGLDPITIPVGNYPIVDEGQFKIVLFDI